MAGKERHDWPLLKERYATSDLSLRQMSDQTGISLRTLATRSRRDGWPQARVDHFNAVAADAQRRTAEAQAQEQVDTATAVRSILRALMSRFAQQVRAKAVDLTPRDFIEVAKLALLMEGRLPADELKVIFGKPPEDMTDEELTAAIVAEAERIATGHDRQPA